MSPSTVIDDGYGYEICQADLDFLQISSNAVEAWQERTCPLGLSAAQYRYMLSSLEKALESDGILEVDVRLQGSSARFFSGHHKSMVWSRNDLIEEFRRNQKRVPQDFEIDKAAGHLDLLWPPDHRPRRRPFDVMFRLGLDRYPSDIDVQISSDEILDRARHRIESLGIEADQLTVHSADYAFVRKDLVEDTCPALQLWALHGSDMVGRNVTIAAFPGSGPPMTSSVVSSHFRTDDWVLLQLGGSA